MSGETDLKIDGLSDFTEAGSGGFGTVYSAYEVDLDRWVAVKVLSAVDDTARRRFDRERITMGRTADHPNIVTPLRSGYTNPDNKPYLVMEYMAGGSLEDRLLADGAMGWGEAIRLVLSIADALAFSHSLGVVHKDIKPANILISRTGIAKLADFGIAAIREGTATGHVAFSMLYTAPETFSAAQDPNSQDVVDPRDERSDLYSLAATLYVLGTGHPPFQSATSAGLINQVLTASPPATDNYGLDRFFATAMAKDPDDRYPTAAQFVAELKLIEPLDPTTVNGRLQAIPSNRQPRRRVFLATAVLLTVLAAVPIIWAFNDRESSNSTVYTGHTASVWAIAELSSGQVATASDDGTVRIWDPAVPETTQAIYTGHSSGVNTVIELADGRIASASDDETAQIWDPAVPETTQAIYTGHTHIIRVLVELGDGRIASASIDGTVQVWDPGDPGTTHGTYTGHTDWVWTATELSDARIASGDGIDGTVQIWDPNDPNTTHATYTGHTDGIWAIVELSDGRIASGGTDSTVQIWDPNDPNTTHATYTGHTDGIWAIVELSDGRIASGGTDSTVQIWDPNDPNTTHATYTGHTDELRAIVELSDGRIASGGTDSTVQIWSPDEI